MRNIARRGVLSIMVVLLVGVAYTQQQIEDETVVAKASQESIRDLDIDKEFNIETEETIAPETPNAEAKAAEAAASSENKARSFRATAYCLKGRTASGKRTRRGIVAADPRVLPLGTRIAVTGGKYSGGYLVADTGKKIRGKKIDIWMPSCREARRWGNRSVKVRVTKKRSRRN